ncbi:MAG: PBSX family phage terminase large subunit [Clostridia bacterium]|nr:PBSX family phage terminase large subunit [Clostridia bacterium]
MNLKDAIAPSFFEVHNAIKCGKYTHYFLKGGRGSCKSSFVSVEIILGIMKNKDANAVVLRRVASSLRDSVVEQLNWAADLLGVLHLFKTTFSPTEMVFLPTGQKILFRGADDVKKIKSTKASSGYIRYVWFEECDEFKSYDDILSVNQSLLRGGKKFDVFYTFNPPNFKNHWINSIECDKHTLFHHSTYLSVPESWLGEQFFLEAKRLESTDMDRYRHQYLGEIITPKEQIIRHFEVKDNLPDTDIKFLGQDFGFNHANAILEVGFTEDTIYIFKEHYVKGMDTTEIIKDAEGKFDKSLVMWCDSAEPDRIKMWKKAGFRAAAVSKEPGSVSSQIDFLLSHKIVIHSSCVNTIYEMSRWCWMKDKLTGECTDRPVPINDDLMAALRYSIEYLRKAGF